MAGGSLPAQSRAGSKKKIKTILPQKSPDCPAEKSSESESDSEEEEEARVINDYDYEALEDIWLKAGEIEAKDLSFSESRRKDGEKGRKRGSSTDEEWKMEEEEDETQERQKLTQNKTKSSKPGIKRPENETEVSSLSEAEGAVLPPCPLPCRKPMEYMFPLASKNLARPAQSQQTKPDLGFENAFLNFCNKKTDQSASQTAPMIRVDYSKHLESKAVDLPSQSLHSTIEKLKSSLSSPGPACEPQSGAGRVLSLLLESGMRPGQTVSILQRAAGSQVAGQALDKLVSEVAQLRQLRSQMSPTHRQLLSHSSQADSAHKAAALAILARLPPHQLQHLHSRLEDSSPPLPPAATSWTGSLEDTKTGWRLTVRPPEPGLSQSFSLEPAQVAGLGLDCGGAEKTATKLVVQGYSYINIKYLYIITRIELSDLEVKLHFGKTYLTVPRTIFQEAPTAEIID